MDTKRLASRPQCDGLTMVERTARGQITRLKLIKRQMYGRAKLDLLQARLVGANCAPSPAKVSQSRQSQKKS